MMLSIQVADRPPCSPSSEQKRRGRKRKTAEVLPKVANATEPTQTKDESPNGPARKLMILFLKFSSQESMPSRDKITSTFSAFGRLDFSETHVSEESSSAEVTFVSIGNAVEALKSLKIASPFGETLVSFRLQPKVISAPGTKAPVISDYRPVLKLINTELTSVGSMRKNLLLMTELLERSGDRVPRETKETLKSDIAALLEKVNSMPSSSSS